MDGIPNSNDNTLELVLLSGPRCVAEGLAETVE
jgi:hypothetical protein